MLGATKINIKNLKTWIWLDDLMQETMWRRPEVFCKKVFLEISQNSQESTCARASFFCSLMPATLLKKRIWHRCFPVNFVKFLTTTFYIEYLWRTASGRHQLCRDGRFELLANSARSLAWAYKLKPLKSSSQISATNWLKVNFIKYFKYMWWAAILLH